MRQRISVITLGGVLISLALLAWTILQLPGASVIRWVALLPAGAAVLIDLLSGIPRPLDEPNGDHELRQVNRGLRQQVQDLTRLRDVMLAMGATFERAAMLDELTRAITQLLHFERGLVLLVDERQNALVFGAYTHAASQELREKVHIELNHAGRDPLLGRWTAGESVLVDDPKLYATSRLNWLLNLLDQRGFYSTPLMIGSQLMGVILVSGQPISEEQRGLLDALAATIAITLENARLYQLSDEKLNTKVQELNILHQIDRELNDALSIERVLNLTLDWALRFAVNSHAATVAFVDHESHVLRLAVGYGYDPAQWRRFRAEPWPLERGISGRVARTGQAENIPDAQRDEDYFELFEDVHSLMAVPITREDRVIAVITLESRHPNAFTGANLEFVERLAARAAVAIDNARLFGEAQRERRKLELILGSTADAVIVVGYDGQLLLVNPAAVAIFRLPPKETYAGRSFDTVFRVTPLARLYRDACELNQGLIEEVNLPGERTFHVSVVPTPEVGWSIVMHDVTPFKVTERLKNELVATASHDLKTPLNVIMGYLDLIEATDALSPDSLDYKRRADRSIAHMLTLIDDLLNLARIESGITLSYNDVSVPVLLRRIVERSALQASEKTIEITIETPPDMPPIYADETRLDQIISNLLSNAVKYNSPGGHVWINASLSDSFVHFSVRDNGLGISPEDQTHVFARFYRVRNAETQYIEGTGLGLAIVKSLVEVHGGQIGLESRLGEGSTFYFTIPYLRIPEQIGDAELAREMA
jgi:signal transduction histidine kinase